MGILFTVLGLLLGGSAAAAGTPAVQLHSGDTVPTVVELYTSQGCSSCPPADAWLSKFQHHPDLFRSVLPLAFHVDYWDRLGWRDRFARPAFSERQRHLQRQGLIRQVYTPGFVVNSAEWRGWFSGKLSLPVSHNAASGALEVLWPAPGAAIHYRYSPDVADEATYLNLAYLGMELCNSVASGENRGRQLCHDFVVLSQRRYRLAEGGSGDVAAPPIPRLGQARTALAVWVDSERSLRIQQAVAGYLPGDFVAAGEPP